MYMQVERRWNGAWLHVAAVDAGQNHPLFWTFGGVRRSPRHDMPPIAPGRGVPVDVSEVTRSLYAGFGTRAYAPTWFTADEARAYAAEHPAAAAWRLWREILPRYEVCTLHADCLEDDDLARACVDPAAVRLVVWFEND